MNNSPIWVCAPDSFKGTQSAVAVSEAIAQGLRRGGAGHVRCIPMADGGEGSLEALSAALPVEWATEEVAHVLPERGVRGVRWLRMPSGEVVLESAVVVGLTLIDPGDRDPEEASTYGYGQLLGAVLEARPQQVVLALGGSATVDGGLGMLQALGARLSVGGRELERPFIGGDLGSLESIDLEPARRQLAGCSLVVATDVQSPLLGPQGAVQLFARQKGASDEALLRLEAGLARVAELLDDSGIAAGDGAAGGLGFGARVGLGAQIQSGARFIAEATGLIGACADAGGVVTGEGCYDEQTQQGKVAWEVAKIATDAGIPCGIVAGSIDRTAKQLSEDPFAWHVSLADLAQQHPECTTDAQRLAVAGEAIARSLNEPT